MIIGISGKKQSGKDTVGKIIQYLKFIDEYKVYHLEYYPVELFIDNLLNNNENAIPDDILFKDNFKIVKYANKLKQVVSLLIKIPFEDLEKEEVKSSKLSEEWTRWYIYSEKIKSHRNPKGIIAKYYSSQLEAEQELLKISNIVDECAIKKELITVRQLLQEVGTDAMRNIVHPNIWVNALFADYTTDPECNWIITDVRFPNELCAVTDRGGITIRVESEYIDHKNRITRINSNEEHLSETALDNCYFDYVIHNNGDIKELMLQVEQILLKQHMLIQEIL